MAGSDADEFNIWLGEFLDTADKPLALTFDEPAVLQQLVEEDLFGELLADVACCTASTTLAGSVRGSIAGTAAPGPPAPLLQHEQHPQQQAPTQPAPLLQQAAAAPKPTKREPRSTRHAKKRRDEVCDNRHGASRRKAGQLRTPPVGFHLPLKLMPSTNSQCGACLLTKGHVHGLQAASNCKHGGHAWPP